MTEENKNTGDNKSLRINGNVLFIGAILLVVVTVFVTFLVADSIYYNGGLFRKSENVSFAGEELDVTKVAKFQDILNFIDSSFCLDYDINEVANAHHRSH